MTEIIPNQKITANTLQSLITKFLWKREEYKLSAAEGNRILSKLEQYGYGYVRRKREGNGKPVEINF